MTKMLPTMQADSCSGNDTEPSRSCRDGSKILAAPCGLVGLRIVMTKMLPTMHAIRAIPRCRASKVLI